MKKWQLEFYLWVKPVAGNETFVESQQQSRHSYQFLRREF